MKTKRGGEDKMNREMENVPLAFQFAEKLSCSESNSDDPTYYESGGTTGGGPASEDANVDSD